MAQNKGYFLPTTQTWDVTEIYQTDVNSDKFKELMVRMYQQLGNMAQQVNSKGSGLFNTQEFATGETFYPNPGNSSAGSTYASPRPVFRKVINFGALPNAATSPKTVAHGITFNASTSLVRLYGSATDPIALNMIPIPYTSGSVPTAAVGISLDATNINIRVSPAADYTMYTLTYIIIEFLKN